MKKKLLTTLILLLLPASVFSAVSTLEYKTVGADGKYLQATTTLNPVLHYKINADTAGDTITLFAVMNNLNSWYTGSATEPESIASGTVRLWYQSTDSSVFNASTAQYVTHLPVDSGANDVWYNDALSLFVQGGSGLWVTIDIAALPQVGTVEFQGAQADFESGTIINIASKPVKPYVMIVTQTLPATSLDTLHSGGTMQPYVSTGQENIIPVELSFFNSSGTGAASIVVTSVKLDILSYSPFGTLLSPGAVIESIKIQNKNLGTIYGQITKNDMPLAPGSLTIPISLCNIPADTTVTANIAIKITQAASAAGQNFVFAVQSPVSISAKDYYTGSYVTVYASASDTSGFPMYSNFASIQKQAETVNIDYTDIIPAVINKGQSNVSLMKITFSNPGDSITASGEVHGLKLAVTDSLGAPVVPSSLFSAISITDGSGAIIYALKEGSDIESTGNTINFSLLNTIVVNAAASATITVRADISSSASANNFKISVVSGQAIQARDKNSFAAVTLVPVVPFPFNSSLAVLSSSMTVANTPLAPKSVYAGQAGMPLMRLEFTSPVSVGNGNILIRGITVTASGTPSLASFFSSFNVMCGGNTFIFPDVPAATSFYLAFPQHITVPAQGVSLTLTGGVAPGATGSGGCEIHVSSHFDAYQDNDPLRQVFVAAAEGVSFPLLSGLGRITGDASSASFTTYPNPFLKGGATTLAYFLESESTVTIKIFDLSGALVRSLISNEAQQAGAHEETAWDGKDDAGRFVLAGTYIARVEVNPGKSSSKKYSRRVTLIK